MEMSDSDFETELLDLLRSGHKIEAIKLYRQYTGQGLAEAKTAVERLEKEGVLSERHTAVDADLEAQIMALLGQGSTIEAIKLVRDRTGASVKSAHQQVQQVGAKLGIRVSERSGCLSCIVLVATTCGACVAQIVCWLVAG